MPLRDDLLNPIPGDNPAGVDLRYQPVYDRIKDARREDDDIPQGDWVRERKTADWKQVVTLAGNALASQSKDLQLAAWLTQALTRTEGFSGLCQGLNLIFGLLENFWETLYPEIEDDDLEMRAAPLDWIGSRFGDTLRTVALTRSGLDWNAYKESRVIGYERDTVGNEFQVERYRSAVGAGKCTAESFDESLNATPKSFYVRASDELSECLDVLDRLEILCDGKFGSQAPGFSDLKSTLDEIQSLVRVLLNRKRQYEPDAAVAFEEAAPEELPADEQAAPEPSTSRRAPPSLSPEPASRADAIARIVAAAAYLRDNDPYSPAPYLLLRALRWGELRAGGRRPDPALMVAPPTALRFTLKSLATECNWLELLKACESAVAEDYGRAWLDLQRLLVRSCEKLGAAYTPIANAIRSELARLMAEFPDLLDANLSDDTPVANAETRAWIRASLGPDSPPALGEPLPGAGSLEAADDAESPYARALRQAEAGLHKEAVELTSAEVARGPDGRSRFRAKLQLADICLRVGYAAMARAILEELARTIDEHRLESWELPESIARVFVLFHRCLCLSDGDPAQKEEIYSRICRLDPKQAPLL